jgi:signal transduction histidine kinase
MLVEKDGSWQVEGDPTEGGLLTAARKGGQDISIIEKEMPRLDSIPFESEHQYMATLHDSEGGESQRVYMKGAVEAILARCESMLGEKGDMLELTGDAVLNDVEKMAAQGLRVLAFATREMPAGTREIDHENVASGLTFLGLIGMIDPPRPEAINAVKVCQAVDAAADLGTLQVDRGRLEDALRRLLARAVGETPAGGRVTLSARRLADELIVEVRDGGPPIAEDRLRAALKPFAASVGAAGGARGADPSLAIARRQVEVCGGRLEAEPAAHGAVLRIRLPVGRMDY